MNKWKIAFFVLLAINLVPVGVKIYRETLKNKNRANTEYIKEMRAKFEQRMASDIIRYGEEAYDEIKKLYVDAYNAGYLTQTWEENYREIIKKYPESNRAGCSICYLAYGLEDEQLYKKAIDEYFDCLYGDGVQVGPYCMYHLGIYYITAGRDEEAAQLFNELREKYPNAIVHSQSLIKWNIDHVYKNLPELRSYYKCFQRSLEDTIYYERRDIMRIAGLYREATKIENEDPAMEIIVLDYIIENNPESNYAGCALLEKGIISRGKDKEMYLRRAIEDYSDCVTPEGEIVGERARNILVEYYPEEGHDERADSLENSFKKTD
ncbi:MAG: tetratricopeptide repeat protein [bacterium]